MKTKMSEVGDNILAVLIIAAVIAVVFLALGGQWVIRSYFEASAYRRVTGKHVSTWDAMFLDLRVISGPDAEGQQR